MGISNHLCVFHFSILHDFIWIWFLFFIYFSVRLRFCFVCKRKNNNHIFKKIIRTITIYNITTKLKCFFFFHFKYKTESIVVGTTRNCYNGNIKETLHAADRMETKKNNNNDWSQNYLTQFFTGELLLDGRSGNYFNNKTLMDMQCR